LISANLKFKRLKQPHLNGAKKELKRQATQVALFNLKMSKNKQNDYFNFAQLSHCLSFKELS